MSLKEDIVGVILAGGKSRRMGTAKALLKFHGVPLIQHIAAVMMKIFASVVIVADDGAEYAFLNLPTHPDIKKNCGPLGGIHSAFVNTHAEKIFVVSCDEPFISKDLIEYICDFSSTSDIKVPSKRGMVEPLCGLYSRNVLPVVERCIEFDDLKVKHLLLQCHTTTIPISPTLPFYKDHLFANLNESSDFEAALHHH
ncbi:MAG: molybdenum cofactor guanylyltransferase [Bacteroidota bacterium]